MADPETNDSTKATDNDEKDGNPLLNTFSQTFINPSGVVKVSIRDSEPFHINHDLLVNDSDYFKACLNPGFKESRNMEVKLELEEEFIEPLGHYIEFLYNGDYNIQEELKNSSGVPPDNDAEKQKFGAACAQQALLNARIYNLGEQIDSRSLKEAALTKFKQSLYVAYDYPHPSKFNKRGYDNAEWYQWRHTDSFASYRSFCHTTSLSSYYSQKAVTRSLISLSSLLKIASFIYKNSFARIEGDDLRKVIAHYFASVIEDLRGQDPQNEVMTRTMEENLDFPLQVLSFVRNGSYMGV